MDQRTVDNLIMPSGWTAARQLEVQSKVDVLGGPPVMAAEAQCCCAGRTLVKSHEISRDRSGIWLLESIAGF